MTSSHTLAVSSCGRRAYRLLNRPRIGRVAAVFERSLLLQFDNDFICLCDPSIGAGPVNIVLSALPGARPEDGARAEGRALVLGSGSAIHLGSAPIWVQPDWPQPAPPRSVAERLASLEEAVARQAPNGGLGRLSSNAGHPETPLNRRAALGVAALQSFINDPSHDARPAHQAVDLLLGLGPGLTPSGDDVLAGVTTTLAALGEHHRLALLGQRIKDRAHHATTPYSAALLACAVNGEAAARWHSALSTVIGSAPCNLDDVLARIAGIGHTSGWDMLAGAHLVLGAYARGSLSEGAAATSRGGWIERARHGGPQRDDRKSG